MSAMNLGMTVDELVAYASKTQLPTLLVEGTGDRALLRRVEVELAKVGVDILPVGGRDRLWDVYQRRHEITTSNVAFLRDRDEWIATGEPPGCDELMLTTGYSIENDVLHKEAIRAIAAGDFDQVEALISLLAAWFKHALQVHVTGGEIDIGRDITGVVGDGGIVPTAQAEMDDNPLVSPFDDLADCECWKWLRGKTLLRAIQSQLAKSSPSYSKDQIMDLCIKLGPSPEFGLLVESISRKFAPSAAKNA